MNIQELIGKSIALIIWNTEQEDDVSVLTGGLLLEDADCYFVNEEEGWKLLLDDEQLSWLQPVTPDLKEMLMNADYALSMSMGDLPDDETEGYAETGMNWND